MRLGEEWLCREHEIQPDVCHAITPVMLVLGSVYKVMAELHKQPVSLVGSPSRMLQWAGLEAHLAWHRTAHPK